MTIEVVILELTDQRSGRKFCDQYGKSSSRKELFTVIIRTMKNISLLMDCIYRKMDAALMFEELEPEYISGHVLCELLFMEMVSTFVEVLVSTMEKDCWLDHEDRSRRYLY